MPPYFGQTHRYALYDAADIAGLNILAEVSDLSCAALQWGIDKEFSPEPTWTIVYDMGATSVGAALVRYSSFEAKEAGKKKQHGQFEIKRTAWDATCGGEDMDMLLVDHFLAEFDAKHKPSKPAKSAPRAIAKLRKQVRKTKEILSANKEAPISVEGMHEDHDFRSSIKRSSFESLAESVGLFDRAVAPLKAIVDALPEYNLTLKDVEVVEVIGGATRVPGVKAALQAALGGRQLDVHLDADEAVAMGAGLFAANMSTTFRMRKFGASDAAPYGYEIDLHDPENPGARKNLLARRKRFPVRRVVSVPNATSDRTFSVYHNVTAGPLPPGVDAEKVADFEIAGVAEATELQHPDRDLSYVHDYGTLTNFEAGSIKMTGNDLDIAVKGDGFFVVQLADGTEAYTRNGAFHLDNTGRLVTSEGRPVLTEGGPVSFTQQDEDLVRAFSAQIAIAIENCITYEQLSASHKLLMHSKRQVEELLEVAGATTAPYLVDPNTGVSMGESADICAYLLRTYAD